MSHFINIAPNEYFNFLANEISTEVKKYQSGIIILGGGNTPKLINDALISILKNNPELNKHFYKNFYFFLSDERFVNNDHKQSNYRMLKQSLFKTCENLIGLNTNMPINNCINDYENKLKEKLADNPIVLSVLGIGNDGHTASLFPHQKWDMDKLVVPGGIGPEGLERISLSHKVLLHSNKIIFTVTNKDKLDAVNRAKKANDLYAFPLVPFIKNKNTYFYTKD